MEFSIGSYVDIVHPKTFRDAMAKEAKVDDARLTFMNVLIAAVISVIVGMLYTVILAQQSSFYAQYSAAGGSGFEATLAKMQSTYLAPLGIAVTLITSVALFYIAGALLFGICKVLGGKGKLANQIHVMSVIGVSATVVNSVIMLLMAVPLVMCVAFILLVAFLLYMLYLFYNMVMVVHPGMDKWRAAAALLVYVVLMWIGMALWSLTGIGA